MPMKKEIQIFFKSEEGKRKFLSGREGNKTIQDSET